MQDVSPQSPEERAKHPETAAVPAHPTGWMAPASIAWAVIRRVAIGVFTADLFVTGNDTDNRAAVAAVPREKLDLAGIAIRTDRKTVDKVTDGLRLHP